ncbi:MAG TPA: hypothetical protein VM120_02885 [Bryobacteraceae bacterium]|nr:hypothetical protein [Bryobacteraceae bacterium]
MSTCRECGQKIIFRHIEGVCTPIHSDGECGDFGKNAVPLRCPECGQMAYFIKHNGGTVWVDLLGPPWPKHKCSDSNSQPPTVIGSAAWTPNLTKLPTKQGAENIHHKQCELCLENIRPELYYYHKKTECTKRGQIQSQSVSATRPEKIAIKDVPHTERRSVSAERPGQLDPSKRTPRPFLRDKKGLRQCPSCSAMVKPANYNDHLKKRCPKVHESHQSRALLTVSGLGNSKAIFVADDLSKLAQQTITALDQSAPVTFHGVLLSDLLAKVTLPIGDKFTGTAAAYYVLAEGSNGNRAVFAWAELDSSFMDRKVYVVNMRDGKPLPEMIGPLQLVIPSEKRATRWLRQLASLKIKEAI